MNTRWFRNLDEQKTKDIREGFKEAHLIRKRIQQMLTDIIEEKRKGQVLESLYDNPNWVYLQADRTGYERALRDIYDLISD